VLILWWLFAFPFSTWLSQPNEASVETQPMAAALLAVSAHSVQWLMQLPQCFRALSYKVSYGVFDVVCLEQNLQCLLGLQLLWGALGAASV
jgi:hypothetical protein